MENLTEGNILSEPTLYYTSGLIGWKELSYKIDEPATVYNTGSSSWRARAPTNQQENSSSNTDSKLAAEGPTNVVRGKDRSTDFLKRLGEKLPREQS